MIIFYLDKFKLSHITFIKYIQLFIFIISPFILIFHNLNEFNLVCNIKDSTDDINIHTHGHITVDKEAGKAIGQGLSTIGTQVGLGATMVGISTAVSKTIAKSSIPPVQKAGLIIGAGAIGGLTHSRISALNRNEVLSRTVSDTTLTPVTNNDPILNINTGPSVNKFINNFQMSPLEESLYSAELMDSVFLIILFIIIIQLIFKLYLRNSVNLPKARKD